jgi:antitoxin component YwqK of YwqJK toxin-antitoxin module
MRYVTTLIAVCLLHSVMGKSTGGQDAGNYTDANGLKQNHWIFKNDTKHLPGYNDADKVEEGDYKDNLKQGIWIQYYPGGALKNKITFKDNRPDGYTITYFQSGKVNEEGIWHNNRWVGDYKLCYENGNVQHQFHYNDNGKRDGAQHYFYDNGKPMIDCTMTAGKQTGLQTEYYDDGSVKSKSTFVDGNLDASQTQVFPPKNAKAGNDVTNPVPTAKEAPKPSTTVVTTDEKPNIPEKKDFTGEGYWKLYNKNKQISKDGVFHGGHLVDGKDYLYSDDGILQKIAVYKAGVYQGDAPITDEDKK